MRTQSPDTSPEAERILVDAWARMSPAQKLHVVGELSRAVDELATAGIRATRPDATDDEVVVEIAIRRYGAEAVARAVAARARRAEVESR